MQEEDKVDALFVTPDVPEEAPAAAEAPAPEPAVEPGPEPAPEPVKTPDHTVPLPRYLDERDRRKTAEARVAEFEAQQQPSAVPDPYDDPKGFAAHVERVAEAKATNNRFQLSDVIAKREFGDEAVQTATEWALERAKTDQTFAAQYMREAHPIDWIVRQHKRDGLVSQLPADISSIDELVEREIAKRGLSAPAAPMPAAAAPQPAKLAAPPKSIASDPPSAGTVQDPSADFMDIFRKG